MIYESSSYTILISNYVHRPNLPLILLHDLVSQLRELCNSFLLYPCHCESIPLEYYCVIFSLSSDIDREIFSSSDLWSIPHVLYRRIIEESSRSTVILEVPIEKTLSRDFIRLLELFDIAHWELLIVRCKSRDKYAMTRKRSISVRLIITPIDMSFIWIESLQDSWRKPILIVLLSSDTSREDSNTLTVDLSRFVNESIGNFQRSKTCIERITRKVCKVKKEYLAPVLEANDWILSIINSSLNLRDVII